MRISADQPLTNCYQRHHVLSPESNDNSSERAEETVTPSMLKSRAIFGNTWFPVSRDNTPEIEAIRETICTVAKEEGLDPFDTVFWVTQKEKLLQAAARSGFPRRYRHWSWGQEYQELHLPHKHGLMNIFEMVINNDPCHAYLSKENPLYDQKIVIAHVMAHSDFFKNNFMFKETSRDMIDRIGDHANTIQRILDTQEVPFEEVEKFIDKIHSIEWLIDFSARKPRDLVIEGKQLKEIERVPEDWGKIDAPDLPSHMQKRLNDFERLSQEREAEQKRREAELRKIPPEPEADVLAFLLEQSTVLKPWQRQILSIIRDESYYFTPQAQTKIMNEGWATYWHMKLMAHPDILDLENAIAIGRHFGAGTALHKFEINPYALGLAIFKEIEERWDKGRYGPKWEALDDIEERKNYDTKAMKGKEKIFEVRAEYNDYEFISEFFTKEIATELKMYTWDLETERGEAEPGEPIVISSKDFEKIKKRILDMLENGGQPLIKVIDGNFKNQGEMLLEHTHSYDLKQDWAEKTLGNLKALYGRPAHLNTYITDDEGEKKKMRISVLDGDHEIKRYIINEEGEEQYECDSNGEPINSRGGYRGI